MSKQLEEIFLFEIRENRKAIKELSKSVIKLDKTVFSNKIKLTIFIAGFTLLFNIIIIVLAEKLKTYFT